MGNVMVKYIIQEPLTDTGTRISALRQTAGEYKTKTTNLG